MQVAINQNVYFRNAPFDVFFVWGIPAIALITLSMVVSGVMSLDTAIMLDLSLLGYHHVISTYTRLCFDSQSLKENRRLLMEVPLIVLVAVVSLVHFVGAWIITVIYLHWQWWHYTRQSEGISKALGMKAQSVQHGDARVNRLLFYLTPVTAFLAMSARQPDTFLFSRIYTLPVPQSVVLVLAMANAGLFLYWFAGQCRALSERKISFLHFSYFISHHVIYVVAYVVIKDITTGWLAINMWHNMQYILFVWVSNVNRFKRGVEREKLFISWISQAHRWAIYFSVCLIITYLFYSAMDKTISRFSNLVALPLTVIIYQSINFHHYVVDATIWKLRKKPVRELVGVESK